MVTIDVPSLLEAAVNKVSVAYSRFMQMLETRVDFGDILFVLFCLTLIAAAYEWHRRWVKRRGFRMVLKDRNDKIHSLLLDILTDGIEDAEAKQKISRKEASDLYLELQKKLGLNDLVPKRRLAQMVKKSLKTDRILREKARKNGTEKLPKIPGGPPAPITKAKDIAVVVVQTASKFWRKPAA